ncbi:8711_t:CDS:2, partial [Entrophospora sp. SA101]
MDAFANESTLTFLRQYRGKDIQIFDNKYQTRKGESVKILYGPDKGAEAMRKGLWMLQEDVSPILTRVYFGQIDGKQRQEDFADINSTWSGHDCVIYTSTVEAGISFEVPNHFDAIIAISNINTGVHVEAFAQMLYRIRDCPCRIISLYNNKKPGIFKDPNRDLIRAELSALRPGDLPVAIKGCREWNKIADCYALDSSPAVETYIEVEYQRRLSAKYFPEILCSPIASTGASLDLFSVENSNLAKADRVNVSNDIKGVAKKIEVADPELIANSPDIGPNEAELLKQIPTHLFADKMILQRYYLWRTCASGDIGGKDDIQDLGMDHTDCTKLCDVDFVKNFNSPEPLQHFRRLAYFEDKASNDLCKSYSAKQWEAVHDLYQSLGFSDIDDTKILLGDDVSKAFEQTRKKFDKMHCYSLDL